MEFILNLKSKKSESKYSRARRTSDCFEVEDRREEQK